MQTNKPRGLEREGAQTLDRLLSWWDRYQRLVLGILGGVVVVGAVAFFMLRSRAAQEEQAAGQLAEASILYWQGDYRRSLELANQVSASFGSIPSAVEAHRLAGDNLFWSGDFGNAVGEYRRYLGKARPGLLSDAVRRSLAYALESDGQALEAAKVYEELVGRFDRGSSAEFLMAAARCYRTAGREAEAIPRLRRVVQEFGETSYARQAQITLGEIAARAP